MSLFLREAVANANETGLGVVWEEVPCPLCGGGVWSPWVEGADHTAAGPGLRFLIVQCRACGLCYTNPRPQPESMEQFYRAEYKSHVVKDQDLEAPSSRWLAYGRRLRKRLPVYGQARLLDFGCGSGSFLVRMKRQGWQVTGVDLAEAAIHRLRARHGVHALVGTLPHPALEGEHFDVVTMWQALEHVHQPLEVLQAAHELLAPRGQLIIEVPNIASLSFRWFGSACFLLDLPRHLTHFTAATLRSMLNRAGFTEVRIRFRRRTSWLRASARLARDGGRTWKTWLAGTRFGASALGWYACLTRQGDCLQAVATKS